MPRVPPEDRSDKDGSRYSASLLQVWKAEHGTGVERVTGIDPQKQSHILLFGANIGEQCAVLKYADAAAALFPELYPAADKPIVLGMVNSEIGKIATERSGPQRPRILKDTSASASGNDSPPEKLSTSRSLPWHPSHCLFF